MRRLFFLVLLCLGVEFGLAYEWRSHNRMGWNARDIFIGEKGPPFPVDQQLVEFLRQYGGELDTRAGDPYENAFTDEDHNEGYLRGPSDACVYREEACWQLGSVFGKKIGALTCTFDHFLPKLALPLGQEEASTHARYYFDMAVKLYKAAKCDSRGKAGLYYQWAARALVLDFLNMMTYGALERRPTSAMAAGWWVCQERVHSSSFSLRKSGGGLSLSRANIRRRTGRLSGPESSSTRLIASPTMG